MVEDGAETERDGLGAYCAVCDGVEEGPCTVFSGVLGFIIIGLDASFYVGGEKLGRRGIIR